MSQEVPELFDPVKAGLAIARAKRMGAETFLLDRAAEDLGERLRPVLRDFRDILEIGTPSGLSDALVAMRPSAGSVTITRLTEAPERPGDLLLHGQDLGLEAGRFDLILSGMLFHRVNDLPGLMIQLRRALKPDGLMMAVFPGGDTLHELRDALLSAESELTGGAAMRVLPMIDVRTAGQLLQRAGFSLPVTDSETVTVRYGSLVSLVRDLRAMAANATLLRREGPQQLKRAIILRAAELYAQRYGDPDGKIRARFEFIWMSGWAPHESQQKPLKPGSAKARLADALKTIETGLEKE